VVKIKKYDTGTPEEFLRWGLVLNEQVKNHGYSENYEMVMKFVPSNVGGTQLRSIFELMMGARYKNNICKAKEQT
jgi:hypothetical protein